MAVQSDRAADGNGRILKELKAASDFVTGKHFACHDVAFAAVTVGKDPRCDFVCFFEHADSSDLKMR